MTEHQAASNRAFLIVQCARVAHEANLAYCKTIGDDTHVSWDFAPSWQIESAIAGVEGVIAGNTPEQSHESWLEHKRKDGWVYGPVKDPDKKTHPCMVSYGELPPEQRVKDLVFVSVVKTMAAAVGLL